MVWKACVKAIVRGALAEDLNKIDLGGQGTGGRTPNPES